ncbi:MAG TPA: aminotransferase class V-fold PLP-dependent enzyme [Firmicutes bacterium]|nr:aminotransferase class V-fold PLP-dependent enzyme [Bacillota bacterium]
MLKPIEFRSDTSTLPTEAMLEAMRNAELGNDSWGEDPTVNRLQEMAADITGKEAALFLPSGTMANLLAAMTHAEGKPWGSEVIVSNLAHTYWYEAAGLSRICGLSVMPVATADGHLTDKDVHQSIRPKSKYAPRSLMVWMENSCMLAGGTTCSVEQMKEVYEAAKAYGLLVHLDGARVFNASVAMNVAVSEIARWSDSLMFCISKGLSCPMGSILCGPREFIEKAIRNRIMLGGGMRQAGVLAAAGIVALESMVDRLREDHSNARRLAEGFDCLAPGSVSENEVQTNIVRVRPQVAGIEPGELVDALWQHDIRAMVVPGNVVRFVVHRHISEGDVEKTLSIVAELFTKSKDKK